MLPKIDEIWAHYQFPTRKVRINKVLLSELGTSSTRIHYEYLDSPQQFTDTIESFTDDFERLSK